ncbi:MAG: hypothetical protein OEY94_04020 [Alphaproteobacteria bacterium]|nr:hypothetical protein [Alphaproteobacteria bacterium]
MSSTQQAPQTSFPTSAAQPSADRESRAKTRAGFACAPYWTPAVLIRYAHRGGDERSLKVFLLNPLKKLDKTEKEKMKRYEQTIGLRVGNFLKRQFKLYKPEKPSQTN